MSALIHAVVAHGANNEVLHVIACFSEQQVRIAKKNILEEYPKASIKVKTSPADHQE